MFKKQGVIDLNTKNNVSILLISVFSIMLISSVTLSNVLAEDYNQVQDSVPVPQFNNDQINNNDQNNNQVSNNNQNNNQDNNNQVQDSVPVPQFNNNDQNNNNQNNNQVSNNNQNNQDQKLQDNYKTSSKSKYAKLTIRFTDLGKFKGSVKLVLKNLDTNKVILKETAKKVSLNNNVKSYKIKFGNNRIGDNLDLGTSAKTLQSGTGFWGFPLTFEKSMKVDASLEEIDCGGDCD